GPPPDVGTPPVVVVLPAVVDESDFDRRTIATIAPITTNPSRSHRPLLRWTGAPVEGGAGADAMGGTGAGGRAGPGGTAGGAGPVGAQRLGSAVWAQPVAVAPGVAARSAGDARRPIPTNHWTRPHAPSRRGVPPPRARPEEAAARPVADSGRASPTRPVRGPG